MKTLPPVISLWLSPAQYMGHIFYRREIDCLFRTVEFTIAAQHAFLRIFDCNFLTFLIQPENINGTAVDANSATVASVKANINPGSNPLGRHRNDLLAHVTLDLFQVNKSPLTRETGNYSHSPRNLFGYLSS